ncbi:hypothetical protein CAPTEDRAFT_223928 [Capitella teleta]|uniref:R3H domain-containing protein n=1 Tax=Capitella teleta TaxID=283909 RepID=R7VB39_CAPTE|nr:hypothetical protein CAPTEDRAFT_223928 [Capitella teleta]|eukprot:ELU15742.1 hypothetical protein CAPTEDRAFT_223928 [Capitella teleta]
MADLLGSILGSMEKPPSAGEEEQKKAKARKKQIEKLKEAEKNRLQKFRLKTQAKVEEILKDPSIQKHKFQPMDKVSRSIVHEVCEIAGLTSFSFGHEEEDRHVMVWKKEYAPNDEELNAYKRGEDWNPEEAKQKAMEKLQVEEAEMESRKRGHNDPEPKSNYKDKYQHLIGTTSAKEAEKSPQLTKPMGLCRQRTKKIFAQSNKSWLTHVPSDKR